MTFAGPRNVFRSHRAGEQPFRGTSLRGASGDAIENLVGLQASSMYAGSRIDSIGGVNLVAVGSAVQMRPALGLKANQFTSRMFKFARADGTAWQAPNAAFANFTGTAELWLFLWRSADPANMLVNIAGKRDGTPNPGYELTVPSSGAPIQGRMDDGPTNYDSTTAETYNDGQWHVLGQLADPSVPRWVVAGEKAVAPAASLPAAASAVTRWSIGANRLNTAGQEIALALRFTGAQLHGVNLLATIQALYHATVEDLGTGATLVLNPDYSISTDGNGNPLYA